MVFSRVKQAFVESFLISACGVVVLTLVGALVGRALSRNRGILVESSSLAFLAIPPEVFSLSVLVWVTSLASESVPIAYGILFAVAVALPFFLKPLSPRTLLQGFSVFTCVMLVYLGFVHGGAAKTMQQQGISLLIVVWLGRFLPFIARLFRQGFEAGDPDATHAAQLAGRGAVSRWWRVELPAIRPTLLIAMVFSWVLCFTELPSTLVALRPGYQTVQMRIFNMVHYQSIGEVSALCVLSILAAMVPLIAFSLFTSGRPRQ
jgi:ABC-type Fe3+ transport system permease subunit